MSSYQVDSARMKKDLATLVAINTENPPAMSVKPPNVWKAGC
ncbi:peptidase, ArgE/DapE family [Klebsiella michiganensis]|uniref:Peptidase, ArgE/DapE family n=1 Tax=Klebsiella michiganensis TaxID=1134687 RepID=A0A7H4LVS9_9ENTR|nr:peptidase, ArgE/DapE family [Klebsiella michiganensis]